MKLVQCQPRLKRKIQLFVVQGVGFTHTSHPFLKVFSISVFSKGHPPPPKPLKKRWWSGTMKMDSPHSYFCSNWFTPSFLGFWGHGWPLKMLKWKKKLLGMTYIWVIRTPSTTDGWILQLVGFGIAPVWKKCCLDLYFWLYTV